MTSVGLREGIVDTFGIFSESDRANTAVRVAKDGPDHKDSHSDGRHDHDEPRVFIG
jgi:hypothetical protein